MAHTKVTLCLEDTTFKRLKTFSRRSGMPQSTLVEQMVSRGLSHLEKHWQPADDVLDQAFSGKSRIKDTTTSFTEPLTSSFASVPALSSSRGKRSKRP
jgi:hypothetical protein